MSSIYTELIRIGMNEEAASELQDVVNIHSQLVTKDYLDSKLQEMSSNLKTLMITLMLGMTAIFGLFMTISAWLLKK